MRISDWSSDVCSSDLLVIPSFGQDHAVGDNLDLAAIVGREDAPSLAILHVSVDHGGRDASVPKCISNVNGMSDSRTEYYGRSEEHTSELQSLMRSSYAVFCLKKKKMRIKKNT